MQPIFRNIALGIVLLFIAHSERSFAQGTRVKTRNHWWNSAVFYEVWPRSFRDSNKDGIGDLAGVTEKLDYLVSLGVDALWLTPIFEAPSYHGYDFTSFYKLDSDYGTERELENFLEQAHKQGIRVIADLVLNHVSAKHEWFEKSVARDAVFENYFVWSKSIPSGSWKKPWGEGRPEDVWHWHDKRKEYYYGVFGPDQPDLNFANQNLQKELFAVAEFWLKKGFDGFRLDAARYLFESGPFPNQADTKETIAFWKQFRKVVKSIRPDAVLVGEVWADSPTVALYHNKGSGLDLCFDFDFGRAIIKTLANKESDQGNFGRAGQFAADTSLGELFKRALEQRDKNSVPQNFYATFLTNHDQDRIMHELGGSLPKAKLAATLLLTLSGTPFLYYGEEIGLMQEKTGDDVYKRAPMHWDASSARGFSEAEDSKGIDNKFIWVDDPKWTPWVSNFKPWWRKAKFDTSATQNVAWQAEPKNQEHSLLQYYSKLIRLHKQYTAFQGPTKILPNPPHASTRLLAYTRTQAEQTALSSQAILVLANTGSEKITVDPLYWKETLAPEAQRKSGSAASAPFTIYDLVANKSLNLKVKENTLTLEAFETVVAEIRPVK